MRRRSQQRGYTAVEVLSAMTLFAIGAAGVIGMQKVTVKGGEDARRFDMATNIANEWVSRLQRDAMTWTQPNANFPTVSNLATHTTWIQQVDVGACNTAFCTPLTAIPAAGSHIGRSSAFDMFGRDLSADDDHMYCVQYRLNWLVPQGTAPALNPMALIRAEVRVFWSRLERAPIGNCANPPVDPDGAQATAAYHFVHATTAIRENALR